MGDGHRRGLARRAGCHVVPFCCVRRAALRVRSAVLMYSQPIFHTALEDLRRDGLRGGLPDVPAREGHEWEISCVVARL